MSLAGLHLQPLSGSVPACSAALRFQPGLAGECHPLFPLACHGLQCQLPGGLLLTGVVAAGPVHTWFDRT